MQDSFKWHKPFNAAPAPCAAVAIVVCATGYCAANDFWSGYCWCCTSCSCCCCCFDWGNNLTDVVTVVVVVAAAWQCLCSSVSLC